MQQLMKLLERDQYIHWHRLKDEDVVRDIFWSHPDAAKLTNAWMTFSAVFAYLEGERLNNIVWALQWFQGLFLKRDALPGVIVTDRHLALMNVVKTVFPDATNLLCRFHIDKNVKAKCKTLNPYVVGTLYKVHLQLVHTTPNSRLYGSNLVNIARFTSACGGVQPILDHLQSEGVYTFLMGLNENFLNNRQVDNSSLPTESQMACAVQAAKGKFTKKEIPTCSHCGVLGHIKEKCYKIHSYPPSYSKKGPRTKHVVVVNHVVDQQNTGAHDANGSSSLSSQQYQMMMQFIQAQMAKVASVDSDQSSNFCLEFKFSFKGVCQSINSICILINKQWQLRLQHTLRQGNACVDWLAKLGASSQQPLIYDFCPAPLSRCCRQ
ncbi:hypothetical protein D0Y65_030591 [Glycine soja]|uniref:MULE transposase domain-containing protein n=1 Tax=Glycine soja TaxID=3848 RepID=A0A445I468_GLYSO|nr:hypothetical protein D0Y65_030591 [Glycine soja]